jgi:hypothetical protein
MGFALAKSKTDAPLTNIGKPSSMPTDLVMAFPAFNTCPFVSALYNGTEASTAAMSHPTPSFSFASNQNLSKTAAPTLMPTAV